MTSEERQALKKNIIDSIQSFDIWRQEEVERGGVRVHLQCTKRELDFLLGLIENKEESKHGEWIKMGEAYVCSRCSTTCAVTETADKWIWHIDDKFCRGCGADMRGSTNE